MIQISYVVPIWLEQAAHSRTYAEAMRSLDDSRDGRTKTKNKGSGCCASSKLAMNAEWTCHSVVVRTISHAR